MNYLPLRESAIERELDYVSVGFECAEEFDTGELPCVVDTEGCNCKHPNDPFTQHRSDLDQPTA